MINVKIDSKKFEASLKQFSKTLNKEASESVIEIARATSNQLAIRSKPYGTNKKTEDISKKAVLKDINLVYQNVGITYNLIKQINPKKATAYAYAMNNNQEDKAEKIAQSVISGYDIGQVDTGQRLDDNRNSKGRVVNPKTPIGINNTSDIGALKAKKLLGVGLAKKGWLQAGLSLASKARIPAWLKTTLSGLGSSKVISSGWNTTVTLINHVSYASDNLSNNQVNAALFNAYKNQLKRMQKQIQAGINKLK